MNHARPRIYIIGPFRGESEYQRRRNIARAEEAALRVAEAGAFYRCPHLHSAHFDGEANDALDPASGAASKGSIAEVEFCKRRGLEVLVDLVEVDAFCRCWACVDRDRFADWRKRRAEERAEEDRRWAAEEAADADVQP